MILESIQILPHSPPTGVSILRQDSLWGKGIIASFLFIKVVQMFTFFFFFFFLIFFFFLSSFPIVFLSTRRKTINATRQEGNKITTTREKKRGKGGGPNSPYKKGHMSTNM